MFFQHDKLLKIYESFGTCLKYTNMQYVVYASFYADHSSCLFFAFDYCVTTLHAQTVQVGNPLFKQVLCCGFAFWIRKSRLFSIH